VKHQVYHQNDFFKNLFNISLLAPTPCQPNPCQNGGTCIPQGTTSFLCQCPSTFYGYCCENRLTTTTPYNPCLQSPCQNGGTCIPQGLSFRCQCTSAFYGFCCETRLTTTTPYNPCLQSPCQNGGTCIPQGLSFVCQCPSTFYGYCCENRIVTTTPCNPCLQSACQNGGQCLATGCSKFLSSTSKSKYTLFFSFFFQHLFVDVQLVIMVLDVNHVIIVRPIHVLIMVIVCNNQRVTLVHVWVLTLVLIANKVR